MKYIALTILTPLSVLWLGVASAQEPDFKKVLQRIDQRSTFQDDLSATLVLENEDPVVGDDLFRVRLFRRDADELFMYLFEEPTTQLGQGYLNVRDGLWFYDPESRQFTYVLLSESFADTAANNGDLGAFNLAPNYTVAASGEGTLGDFEVWILDLEAVNDEVTYPYKKVWISKDDTLLLKSEDYSLTKRLLRTSYYPSYTRAGDNYIANKMIFIDALVEGRTATLTLTDISTEAIPDSVFTKAYVERVNR